MPRGTIGRETAFAIALVLSACGGGETRDEAAAPDAPASEAELAEDAALANEAAAAEAADTAIYGGNAAAEQGNVQ